MTVSEKKCQVMHKEQESPHMEEVGGTSPQETEVRVQVPGLDTVS